MPFDSSIHSLSGKYIQEFIPYHFEKVDDNGIVKSVFEDPITEFCYPRLLAVGLFICSVGDAAIWVGITVTYLIDQDTSFDDHLNNLSSTVGILFLSLIMFIDGSNPHLKVNLTALRPFNFIVHDEHAWEPENSSFEKEFEAVLASDDLEQLNEFYPYVNWETVGQLKSLAIARFLVKHTSTFSDDELAKVAEALAQINTPNAVELFKDAFFKKHYSYDESTIINRIEDLNSRQTMKFLIDSKVVKDYHFPNIIQQRLREGKVESAKMFFELGACPNFLTYQPWRDCLLNEKKPEHVELIRILLINGSKICDYDKDPIRKIFTYAPELLPELWQNIKDQNYFDTPESARYFFNEIFKEALELLEKNPDYIKTIESAADKGVPGIHCIEKWINLNTVVAEKIWKNSRAHFTTEKEKRNFDIKVFLAAQNNKLTDTIKQFGRSGVYSYLSFLTHRKDFAVLNEETFDLLLEFSKKAKAWKPDDPAFEKEFEAVIAANELERLNEFHPYVNWETVAKLKSLTMARFLVTNTPSFSIDELAKVAVVLAHINTPEAIELFKEAINSIHYSIYDATIIERVLNLNSPQTMQFLINSKVVDVSRYINVIQDNLKIGKIESAKMLFELGVGLDFLTQHLLRDSLLSERKSERVALIRFLLEKGFKIADYNKAAIRQIFTYAPELLPELWENIKDQKVAFTPDHTHYFFNEIFKDALDLILINPDYISTIESAADRGAPGIFSIAGWIGLKNTLIVEKIWKNSRAYFTTEKEKRSFDSKVFLAAQHRTLAEPIRQFGRSGVHSYLSFLKNQTDFAVNEATLDMLLESSGEQKRLAEDLQKEDWSAAFKRDPFQALNAWRSARSQSKKENLAKFDAHVFKGAVHENILTIAAQEMLHHIHRVDPADATAVLLDALKCGLSWVTPTEAQINELGEQAANSAQQKESESKWQPELERLRKRYSAKTNSEGIIALLDALAKESVAFKRSSSWIAVAKRIFAFGTNPSLLEPSYGYNLFVHDPEFIVAIWSRWRKSNYGPILFADNSANGILSVVSSEESARSEVDAVMTLAAVSTGSVVGLRLLVKEIGQEILFNTDILPTALNRLGNKAMAIAVLNEFQVIWPQKQQDLDLLSTYYKKYLDTSLFPLFYQTIAPALVNIDIVPSNMQEDFYKSLHSLRRHVWYLGFDKLYSDVREGREIVDKEENSTIQSLYSPYGKWYVLRSCMPIYQCKNPSLKRRIYSIGFSLLQQNIKEGSEKELSAEDKKFMSDHPDALERICSAIELNYMIDDRRQRKIQLIAETLLFMPMDIIKTIIAKY